MTEQFTRDERELIVWALRVYAEPHKYDTDTGWTDQAQFDRLLRLRDRLAAEWNIEDTA